MPLHLEIVTAERVVYQDDVDMVIAPAWNGTVGILPHHAPLLTTLQIGELLVRKGGAEQALVIAGGFLEVNANRVTILADFAEHAEEIDVQRAEEARRRAQESLTNRGSSSEGDIEARAALRRASFQLRVARNRRSNAPPPRQE